MAETGSDQYLKERLEFKALKSGLGAFKLVGDICGTVHGDTWKSLMRGDELPVLADVEDESNWCLFTTKNLIWKHQESQQTIQYLSMSKCRVPALDEALKRKRARGEGMTEEVRNEILRIRSKCQFVGVTTNDGKEHEVYVPGGYVEFAVGLVFYMMNLSRIHAK